MTIDSPSDFKRKNDQMFERMSNQLDAIGRRFIVLMAEDIVVHTPGFGNQDPEDTPYIPTGRLRGGWDWSETPQATASRRTGGPYSDYGAETVARITSAVMASPRPSISYLQNDVLYGHLVRWGLARHVSIRNWPQDTADKEAVIARKAITDVMRGLGGET